MRADRAARALSEDARLAAALLAVDPHGLGGARLRGPAGPARDAWLTAFRDALGPAPARRCPAQAGAEALLGGLDLAATLATGRAVARTGLLASADGGALVLASAERAAPETAALIAAAMDQGEAVGERDGRSLRAAARFALVLLDEGVEDEAAPAALRERVAFDLAPERGAAAWRAAPPGARDEDGEAAGGGAAPEAVAAARARLGATSVPDPLVEALALAAEAFGVESPRALIFAARAARAAAALAGRAEAAPEDAERAAALVLAPRATRAPAPEDEEASPPAPEPPEPPADEREAEAPGEIGELAERVLAAVAAAVPAGLLASLKAETARRRGPTGGAAGAMRKAAARGRPIGARPGRLGRGARLDLVETLRAAAPWVALRRREGAAPDRLPVRPEDIRLKRFKRPSESLIVFAVDASGSAAAARLAEAKGAVETLLAESYARRDHVALVAFGGRGVELALPPTRALARAKRALAGLPGGGGTPLADGLARALAEAEAGRRRGWTPTLVLLTDGRANLGRGGAPGRERAEAEALAAAGLVRAAGVAALVIDAAARPSEKAAALAAAMGARHLFLPRADARAVASAVEAARG